MNRKHSQSRSLQGMIVMAMYMLDALDTQHEQVSALAFTVELKLRPPKSGNDDETDLTLWRLAEVQADLASDTYSLNKLRDELDDVKAYCQATKKTNSMIYNSQDLAGSRVAEVRDWMSARRNEFKKGSKDWKALDEQLTKLVIAVPEIQSIGMLTAIPGRPGKGSG